MDPEEACQCGHERKWHDSCSKCDCPWFLTPGSSALKRWQRDRRDARKAAKR